MAANTLTRRCVRLLLAGALLILASSCDVPRPESPAAGPKAEQARAAVTHDLSQDESEGGHTLRKHVRRTDDELRARLQQERNISAASTYSDRNAAENAVGTALQQQQGRIQRWLQRSGSHPNLVLDYDGNPAYPIGRVLRRGDNTPQPCSHAVVVLKWDGGSEYHVLTSYPECR